jgi:hypothetical protein
MDEKRTLQKKGGYTRRIARSRFGCYCPHKRNEKINTGEQHAILTQEMQSALRLSVGFSHIYRDL